MVDSSRFAADYAMILFDGKNKPLVLYGALDAVNAAIDFNSNPPKTPQEAEKLRLWHLRHNSPLSSGSEEFRQACSLLDDSTANFLRGDFSVSEAFLRHAKPQENALVYLASRIMLAYLLQRRGDTEELAELCGELAELQPEKREYWTEKQIAAQAL